MKLNIYCPYCGNGIQLEVKPPVTQDFFCEFCGSSIKEHVVEAVKNVNASTPPAETPVGIPPQVVVPPPIYNKVPAFPLSQISRSPQSGQIGTSANVSNIQTPFPQVSSPNSQGSAYLQMNQIQQTVTIPNNVSEFHFGRNTIYSLVNPTQYDVEWLNSISRVQTDEKGKVTREHFIIYQKGNSYQIEDRSSRWGTWVNKQQIKGKGKTALHKGDKIELVLFKPGMSNTFPFVIDFNY
jgi:hypothetical protein